MRRRALVVVDYQVDFVSGSLGFSQALALHEPLYARVYEALNQGIPVLATLDTHEKNAYLASREGRHLPVLHALQGTEGQAFYGKLNALAPRFDRIFEKQTFGSLELAQHLARFDEVEFVGVVSHLCVLSNVVLAMAVNPHLEVTVNLDLVASPDPVINQTLGHYLAAMHVKVIGGSKASL